MTDIDKLMADHAAQIISGMQEYSLPEYMQGSVVRYICDGDYTGDFLKALFSNDLKGVFRAADDNNLEALHGWVRFIYNCIPSSAQGSTGAFAKWQQDGGLRGHQLEADKCA